MVLRLFICLCLFTFFLNPLKAQKYKQLIKDGNEAFAAGDYFGASQYFANAMLQDSSDIQVQYQYAESCRLNFDYTTAEHWYFRVYKKDNGLKFKECLFWLATMKKQNGRYKEAKKLFEKYYKKYKKKDVYFTKKAKQEMEACDYALLLLSDTLKIKIIHLDSAVNSKVSEYAPFEWNNRLYYSSLRKSKDSDNTKNIDFNKIYYSSIEEDKYLPSLILPEIINNMGIHNANVVWDKNEKVIYFSRCVQDFANSFTCSIYKSKWIDSVWSAPEKLPEIINAEGSNTTQPALAEFNNTKYLFFSSNRNGSKGGMDIWFSKIKSDGSFDFPVNAGNEVNSLDNEITPFFCEPCSALFFSSNWHKGLGGFDIFQSNWNNDIFSEPVNLGYPFNTRFNDIYYSVNDKGTKAYFSSNRIGSYFEKNETCCNDIYYTPVEMKRTLKTDSIIPKDSTVVFSKQAKLLVPLTLYFHNDEPDNKTLNTSTKKEYAYTYNEYVKLIEKYKQEYGKGLLGDEKLMAEQHIIDFFEDSVTSGMHDLEKFAELMEKILMQGKTINITMKGYCSPLASTNYNINLAKRRISSLINYFNEYKNGLFKPYIEGRAENMGKINFVEEDIGELQAKPNTSDNPNDVKNSVYSINAASERKIQIIAFEMQ